MNIVIHKAQSRGKANQGWLQSRHTFSFADYYNPDRMQFGVLRVLNDDIVAPSMGFGTHPHKDMEIISIPLKGDLEHKDNLGNKAVIKAGDIQIMSAGSGVQHSEYNKNNDAEVNFLQIWILPNKTGVKPRYDQITLDLNDRENKLQQVLSPNPDDDGVWIHQNAWFYITKLTAGNQIKYVLRDPSQNGVYIFIISGDITVNEHKLSMRDGMGIEKVNNLKIIANSASEILLMEVPMSV